MRTLTTDQTNALAAGNVVLVQLVKMEFDSGIVALNTSTWDFSVGGVDFNGAYGLGSIGVIDDSAGEIKGLQLELSGAASATISLALDGSDEVQGTPLTIGTLVLNATTHEIVDTVMVDWVGRLDTMSISEDGDSSAVRVTAESRAVDLLRGNPLTYSDADQQTLYAGDRAFEYMVSDADKPVTWPAREYFLR